MYGGGSMFACRVQHAATPQIALRRWRWSDALRFVGHAHMQRRAIGIGENGDAADTEFSQRTNDANGDLAAVGNQNFTKHPIRF
jgi:hypothetical protein